MNNQRFLPTPYEPGVSLRWDIFHSQFTVIVTGMFKYSECAPFNGTYQIEGTLTICKESTLTNAIQKLNVIFLESNWPFQDENIGYYDPNFRRDVEPLSFKPQSVMIYDRYNRKVLGGRIESKIIWARPVTQEADFIALYDEYERLNSYAACEYGWNNCSTARSLWHSAELLLLHVVNSKCSVGYEVNTFLQHDVSVSWNDNHY
ncbi:hypothetical protein KKJ04_17290 [Xenorhabdus bovienii]|uniref:hypothetical protein n=1 Tax=Xenorhabdus bovienii TaxID=40576 RepID=UPI0023B2075C|nr:hypothetical protein [Xenorhabdus bovienii]MDE9447301.1 hypothetical protein [Xenorhabdus bovienii]